MTDGPVCPALLSGRPEKQACPCPSSQGQATLPIQVFYSEVTEIEFNLSLVVVPPQGWPVVDIPTTVTARCDLTVVVK